VPTDLDAIVRAWDEAMCAQARLDGRLSPELERRGTALREPAPAARIEALEARLGMRLPPSFRSFLALSDGASAQPGFGRLARTRRGAASLRRDRVAARP